MSFLPGRVSHAPKKFYVDNRTPEQIRESEISAEVSEPFEIGIFTVTLSLVCIVLLILRIVHIMKAKKIIKEKQQVLDDANKAFAKDASMPKKQVVNDAQAKLQTAKDDYKHQFNWKFYVGSIGTCVFSVASVFCFISHRKLKIKYGR